MDIIETLLGYQIDWGVTAAFLALILSLINFWFAFLFKGKPVYACSMWTAVKLNQNNSPRAAFALNISIYNKGNASLKLFDLFIQVTDDSGNYYYYEPIVLWDLKQWIEDGNRPDRVGRTQKGQVPLPTVIVPDEDYNFGYPVLFLPEDLKKVIDPNSTDEIELKLYSRTNRKKDYELVGTQKFNQEKLQSLNQHAFVSIKSNESISKREELKKEIG